VAHRSTRFVVFVIATIVGGHGSHQNLIPQSGYRVPPENHKYIVNTPSSLPQTALSYYTTVTPVTTVERTQGRMVI